MEISPESLYIRLGSAVATMPSLEQLMSAPEAAEWLGKCYALIAALGDPSEVKEWKAASDQLNHPADKYKAIRNIPRILHRALAVAEMNAPAAVQGAFIPAGNAFDAMVAVGKVLQQAGQDLLIVDPYMDEKVLTDFAGLASAGVTLRLLADQQTYKPTLKPAVTRWAAQHGTTRPVEARLSASRSLHDRLIVVDDLVAWTLTQSFNGFAVRSPASILRVGAETAALKVAAYDAMWKAAGPL